MKNWLTDLFSIHTIKEINSPINGLIKIMMIFNRPRLMIGGMLQSGGMVKGLWYKAIKKLIQEKQVINQALIVGLGCGDCAFAIQKYYPQAKMLGIEIDKQVVDAAQCYFGLATIRNLKISINDGAKYIEKLKNQKNKTKYDLIIVDVYLGDKIPKDFITKKFLKSLTQLLTHDGVVIFNHLFFKDHKISAEKLIKEMEPIFGKITLQRTNTNLLIFAWF